MIEYENLKESNSQLFDLYREAFEEVLESGWYILGKQVKAFEQEFASFNNVRKCIGVASGLDAITLSIKALSLTIGDEVLVPSNTYIATLLSIIHNNLKPVLVEPDIKTYNINPQLIEEKITKKTKAIIVVHLYGKSCEMDKIKLICNKYNLALIEDCAQSHGASLDGKYTGTFGDFGAFSFYPTKNLGALGDAGAILCKTEEHEQTIKRLRNYGSDKKYHNQIIGYNSRLDELQASFLRKKLGYLNQLTEHKRKLAKIYLDNLNSNFILPIKDDRYYDVYHIFNIRNDKRDELQKYLLANNIKSEIHYPIPPHKQKALQEIITEGVFPISEEIHATTLSLPISYAHSTNDIYKVVEVLNNF